MAGSGIERFTALDSAFRDQAGRGERLYARFSALAGLSSELEPEILVQRTLTIRDQLNDGLGAWRAPAKSMRLVFAAALASEGGRRGRVIGSAVARTELVWV